MSLTVTHGFVSGIADDPVAAAGGEVLPSHWNASHTFAGTLPPDNGGTGFSGSYATGTILAGNGATLTLVAAGASGTVLTADPSRISGLTYTVITSGAGTPGGADTQVQYNSGSTFAGQVGFTYQGSASISVGSASFATGKIAFKGTTSGAVTVTSKNAAGTWTLTLPDTSGTSTQVLTTDGTGVTSWASPGSTANLQINTSTITGGSNTRVLYNTIGLVGEAASFTISSGQPKVPAGAKYLYDSGIAIQGVLAGQNWFLANAGNLTVAGTDNIGIGSNALLNVSTGNYNIGIGTTALTAATTGSKNVAIGVSALAAVTTGTTNVGIGYGALAALKGGTENFGLGSSALAAATNPTNCVAIGANALGAATAGDSEIAIGASALFSNTSVGNNIAIGISALSNNTVGVKNIAIGPNVMGSMTSGTQNVGIGAGAHQFTADANDNIAIGISAYKVNIHGCSNVGIGTAAGGFGGDTSGSVFIGYTVGQVCTGNNNTAVGCLAGQSLGSGGKNLILGARPNSNGEVTTGNNNISIGYDVSVATATANSQLCIGNYIYGTSLSGAGSTISPGSVGVGTKSPSYSLHVSGSLGSQEPGFLMHAGATLTDFASNTVATLTNSPLIGNPTKWFAIDDNGTTRFIPAW